MFRLALRLTVIAVALVVQGKVVAAVMERDWLAPGDGLLTFDDINNREWLDLTETQLFKFPGDTLEAQYQVVVDQTLPGGMFQGFTVATEDDVFALAESAGIEISTLNFLTNGLAADHLIELLGNPIQGAATGNKWAAGYLIDSVVLPPLTVEYVPSGRDQATAGFGPNNLFRSSSGIWVFRQVPEPPSFVFAALLTVVFVLMKRMRSLPSIYNHPDRSKAAPLL